MNSYKVQSISIFGIVCLILTTQIAQSLDNGLAKTPPMGWISWVRFMCEVDCDKNPNDCINEKLYMEIAQKMKSDGYFEAGYKYVNIDDCWSEKERDTDSRLVPDAKRFPRGMKLLADYIHNFDLKFGIYGDCGTETCANYPAQLHERNSSEANYFVKDANLFAEWGIDSFKFDGCNVDYVKAETICPDMAKALRETQRPILLTCEWPFYMNIFTDTSPNYQVAADSCNLWRYFNDVEDSWASILAITDWTVKLQTEIVKYHGPGHWFDPDQLVIGNFGLSLDQARAQMALWSIWSAPLFMSNDLREIDEDMAKILKNKQVIEVDQDRMGVLGMMVAENSKAIDRIQAFVKPVEPIVNGCPSFVIVYLNRHTLGDVTRVSFELRDLLERAPIGLAAQRFVELHEGKTAASDFDAEKCKKRIKNAGKKDPKSIPSDLPSQRIDTEYTKMNYKVTDLFDVGKFVVSQLSINSSLTLSVNPSGVRMVKLVEDTA